MRHGRQPLDLPPITGNHSSPSLSPAAAGNDEAEA